MTVTNLYQPPLQQTLVPRVKTEITALWQLAWPILIGQLANVGMAVADVAMAGHASAQDLAGVALGSSVWMIVVVTLMGIMMSVNPTVAHYVGAGQFDRVPHVVRQGLWKALGVGVVAMGLANLSGLVFDHMDLEPLVRDIAVRFVQITSLGLPAFACYRVLYGYSASLDQTHHGHFDSGPGLELPVELVVDFWQPGLSQAGRCGLCLGHHAMPVVQPGGLVVVDAARTGLPQHLAV